MGVLAALSVIVVVTVAGPGLEERRHDPIVGQHHMIELPQRRIRQVAQHAPDIPQDIFLTNGYPGKVPLQQRLVVNAVNNKRVANSIKTFLNIQL